MTRTKIWFVLLLSVICIFAVGCKSGGDDSSQAGTQSIETSLPDNDDGFTAYEDEITMEFGRDIDPNGSDAVAFSNIGEPYTDNRWTRLFKEKLNINIEYKLAVPGDQYNQQIKLTLTSGDLPDYFKINLLSDYQQMVNAGVLADMTDLYEKYASPLLRQIIEKEGTNVYLPVTSDGKMYGIPRKMPSTNGYNHLWIRQDWLNNLNLERPETMEDVLAVARAFTKDDPDGNGKADTLGMRFDNDYIDTKKGIFWGFRAYPDFWLEKDGKAVYGSVQPEMKKAYGFLKTMYDERLIDREFATNDSSKSQEGIVGGKVGMTYGPHWEAGSFKQCKEIDPKAEWVAIALPTEDGSPVKIPLTNAVEGIYVASKDAEHPEALIKLLNAYVEAIFGESGDYGKFFSVEGIGAIWDQAPVGMLDPELDIQGHRDWKKAAEENNYDDLDGSGKAFYNFAQSGLTQYEYMFGPKDTPFAFVDNTYPDQVIWNAYFGAPTNTQVARGSSMDEFLDMTGVAFITGQDELDSGFDKMVEKWYSMGGDQVTKEINEAIENSK